MLSKICHICVSFHIVLFIPFLGYFEKYGPELIEMYFTSEFFALLIVSLLEI